MILKDAHISLVIPKDTHICLVISKDAQYVVIPYYIMPTRYTTP